MSDIDDVKLLIIKWFMHKKAGESYSIEDIQRDLPVETDLLTTTLETVEFFKESSGGWILGDSDLEVSGGVIDTDGMEDGDVKFFREGAVIFKVVKEDGRIEVYVPYNLSKMVYFCFEYMKYRLFNWG